jgi:hypothetical protein
VSNSIRLLKVATVAAVAFTGGNWAATAYSLHTRDTTIRHLVRQVGRLRDAQRSLSDSMSAIARRISALDASAKDLRRSASSAGPAGPRSKCEPRRLSPRLVRGVSDSSRESLSKCTSTAGAIRMSFKLNEGSYALCEFNLPGVGDLLRAGATLDMRFCVSAPISGQMNIWNGKPPYRRFLNLIGPGREAPAGCYTKRLSTGSWCFPEFDEVPKDCRGECGDLLQCPLAFADDFGLAVEWLSAPAVGSIEVTDLVYYDADCL